MVDTKEHAYDKYKVSEPKTLHDYFINQIVETAKNISSRNAYLLAQEQGTKWEVPTIDAATAPLTHLFKSGKDQMDERSLMSGMFNRCARCESGALKSDTGESMSKFLKTCNSTESFITNEKVINGLQNPKFAKKLQGMIDKNFQKVVAGCSPEYLQDWHPYSIEDGTDGSLRKTITPEQFSDCMALCFLKAAKQFAQDNNGVVIDPAKYMPEYKGAFAAENPQVAKAGDKLSGVETTNKDLGKPVASNIDEPSKVTQAETAP